MDASELLQRVRSSAVNASTIDALGIRIEQLCCDYSSADAHELVATGREWLSSVTALLGSPLARTHRRDVLSNAGMLALLVGCLEYDLGDARSAEATRRMAGELGTESDDPDIVGWAHEMLAWFHLTSGNHHAVIPAADAGIQIADARSVSVQLHGQQAKAYARIGMPDKVHQALEEGRALLDNLPCPDRPDHHFVVDPEKWDFYAMDTYRVAGQDRLARRNAEEILRHSVAPMRRAEAQLTLAVVAAREGDVDEAISLGMAALRTGRQSRPSLLMVGGELAHELGTHGADFRDLLSSLKPP